MEKFLPSMRNQIWNIPFQQSQRGHKLNNNRLIIDIRLMPAIMCMLYHCRRAFYTVFELLLHISHVHILRWLLALSHFVLHLFHVRLKEERVTLYSLQSLLGPLHNHLSMTTKDCSPGAAVSKVGYTHPRGRARQSTGVQERKYYNFSSSCMQFSNKLIYIYWKGVLKNSLEISALGKKSGQYGLSSHIPHGKERSIVRAPAQQFWSIEKVWKGIVLRFFDLHLRCYYS